MAVTATLNA